MHHTSGCDNVVPVAASQESLVTCSPFLIQLGKFPVGGAQQSVCESCALPPFFNDDNFHYIMEFQTNPMLSAPPPPPPKKDLLSLNWQRAKPLLWALCENKSGCA
eukprot:1162007-Pelagomonas_calceolata.AAC.2